MSANLQTCKISVDQRPHGNGSPVAQWLVQTAWVPACAWRCVDGPSLTSSARPNTIPQSIQGLADIVWMFEGVVICVS